MKEYNKDKRNRVKRGANRAVYDKEQINKILDENFMGYVGYMYDGYPITIPMAYGKLNNKLYLHGSTANRMLVSILKQGKTAITVMNLDGLVLARSGFHHSVNYRSVTLFGIVKQINNDTKKWDILENIVNKMVPNRWDSLREMTQKELNRTLVVEFTIETASAKIRAEGVIDDPEDEKLPIWAGVIPLKQVALTPISDEKLIDEVKVPKHILEYYEQHK